MSVRLMQVVIEADDQLYVLAIPGDRKDLALRLIQSVFDGGKMAAVKMPPEYRLERLGEQS